MPALKQLGAPHSGYGVQDHHYRRVGTAVSGTFPALVLESEMKTGAA